MFGKLPHIPPLAVQDRSYSLVEQAREIELTRTKQSHEVDKKFKLREFKPGEKVSVQLFPYLNTSKLNAERIWPFSIVRKIPSVACEIDRQQPGSGRTTSIVHSTQLRPFAQHGDFELEPSKISVKVKDPKIRKQT